MLKFLSLKIDGQPVRRLNMTDYIDPSFTHMDQKLWNVGKKTVE